MKRSAAPGLPAPSASPPRQRVPRLGTALKLAWIGLLVLLLLAPVAMIRSVLRERLDRRDSAVANITSTWGQEQTICGPVLAVPYRYRVDSQKVQVVNNLPVQTEVTETFVGRAFFLPQDLLVEGDLTPSVLHRGIYRAVVYAGRLTLSGRFAPPAFDEWKVDPADVLWDEAVVTLAITDLRGTKEKIVLTWDGRALVMEPGSRLPGFGSGIHVPLGKGALGKAASAFEVNVTLNGSMGIRFAPGGRQTRVELTSPWPDPRFAGAFLPAERRVDPEGFGATWLVSYYGRSFPQQWRAQDANGGFSAETVQRSLFGVDLIEVVDAYRHVERSIKYGILFIVLIYAAYFLFEVLSPVRVHPFQYLLVGMALCLFYLALLSLSEIAAFGVAYLGGAGCAGEAGTSAEPPERT